MKRKYILPLVIIVICLIMIVCFVNKKSESEESPQVTEIKQHSDIQSELKEIARLEDSFGYKGSDEIYKVNAIYLLPTEQKKIEIPITKKQVDVSATGSNGNFNVKWGKDNNSKGKKLVLELKENFSEDPTTIKVKTKTNEALQFIVIPKKSG